MEEVIITPELISVLDQHKATRSILEETQVHCRVTPIMDATATNLYTWRAFLKRPENFSGPKTFRGSFRVNFSGPGKRFSTRPKTPWILTRVFRVVFSGLQRELDSDLLRP